MKRFTVRRTALLALATLFLAVSWIWDALIAIGYSIQQPRPRHPDAASEEDRAALKKSSRRRLPRNGVNIRAQASKSGQWMSTALA